MILITMTMKNKYAELKKQYVLAEKKQRMYRSLKQLYSKEYEESLKEDQGKVEFVA